MSGAEAGKTRRFANWMAIVLFTLCALQAAAQVTLGNNVSLNLNGDISTGYTGTFADSAASGHGLNLGGYGQLSGDYYSPKFISFQIQPYFNRSQANSNYQSITDSSGVSATLNFFSGSHFPGSVSFSKTYDGTGQFGIPGSAGLTTNSDGNNLVINWGARLPNLPSLNVSYTRTGQDSTVYGAEGLTHSGSSNLNVNLTHTLAGFNLQGIYTRQSTDTRFPSIVENGVEQAEFVGQGNFTSYGLQASHRIPMNGYWSASVNRSSYETDSQSGSGAGSSDGTSDGINTTVSINPVRRIGLSFGTSYQTNLFAALEQQLLAAGSLVPLRSSEIASHAFGVTGSTFVNISSHITANAQVSHQQQVIGDKVIDLTQYGGGVSLNYSRPFLGAFSFSIGARDTASQDGNSGAGLVGNVNFARKLHGWEIGANFGYSQQIETLLAMYTTSSYSYSATLKRKFSSNLYWSGSFHASHSGLTQIEGSSSRSEGFSTNLSYGRFNANAMYSQSGGVSILTAQGLVAVPTGIPLPVVAQQVLYNARSFGFGGGATYHRWVVTANYSKANSGTGGTTPQMFESRLINARLQYRVRKMYLNAGFTRFIQGLNVANLPSEVNSYYFGISRWFNVF